MDGIPKFQILKDFSEEQVFLNIIGYLDAHTAPELELALKESMEKGKYNIVVDFEKLDYISSAGFGVFMEFIEEIRQKNGDIKMIAMNSKIRHLFNILGFDVLFEIYNDKNQLLGNN